eukprot:Phypoly_transcript_21358.p1 GENE.Phypoly_transcript_21358~~Phypoly_transcript_21358.p1  ORF type:complete len:120 (+),score=16.97 Phypoly_transcript_21358:29-361(+)
MNSRNSLVSPSRGSLVKQMASKPKLAYHTSKMVDVDQFKSANFSSTQFIDNLTKDLVEEQAFGEEFEAASFKRLLDDNLEFLQQFADEYTQYLIKSVYWDTLQALQKQQD